MATLEARLTALGTRLRAKFNEVAAKLVPPGGAIYQRPRKASATDYDLAWGDEFATIPCFFFGGGEAIPAGATLDVPIQFDCDIVGWDGLADQSGSISIEVWLDTYANYPPTSADKISASAPIALSAAIKGRDHTLTGWTKSLPAGSTVRFSVISAATIQRFAGGLKVRKR